MCEASESTLEERIAELEQENRRLSERLAMAISFRVKDGYSKFHPVVVDRCDRRDLPPWWAIRHGRMCLTKTGMWEYEPMPSYRDDEFYARCRWTDFTEALQAAQECTP